jgi:hypothetical protein
MERAAANAIVQLAKAVTKSSAQFKSYAEQHGAKAYAAFEVDDKAYKKATRRTKINVDMKLMCDKALVLKEPK